MLIFVTELFCLVGIKSRRMSDSQMTASSFLSANWTPGVARLNGVRGWAPQSSQGKNKLIYKRQNLQLVNYTPYIALAAV